MKIAIKANPSRGEEIISLLESLGGIKTTLRGDGEIYTYYIDEYNVIRYANAPKDYKVYTLEEFEKEFPFKIGDKVTVITNTPYKIIALEYYMGRLCYKLDNGLNYNSTELTLYKEMKEERNITLTLDKAKEWYKKGGELKEIALQAFTEKELTKVDLPKTWKEFCVNYPIQVGEAFISGQTSLIHKYNNTFPRRLVKYKNVCPSEKSAEAHLAMIQLEQLRNCWWNGWEPEWNNCEKYVIKWDNDDLIVFTARNIRAFLVFPTREMAYEFFNCFRSLIEKAGDLI